jgi:very-short-patch-repair endonuclease
LADHHRACRLQPHGERRPDPLSPSRHFGANGERVRVRGSPKGKPIHEEPPIMRGEQPWRTNRSRVLRSRPISAEAKLWAYLRNRQLGGHKLVPGANRTVFRRLRQVIIEVDGGTHSTDREIADDAKRTSDLQALGYRVFRVCNDDVYHNIDCVLDALLGFIEAAR